LNSRKEPEGKFFASFLNAFWSNGELENFLESPKNLGLDEREVSFSSKEKKRVMIKIFNSHLTTVCSGI